MNNLTFKHYYDRLQKTYRFRIKSPQIIDDDVMTVLERVLSKYRPADISKPKKMMFQTNPLGFTGVKNTEIWFIDAELTIPANAETLRYDILTSFGHKEISELFVVFGEGRIAAEEEAEKDADADVDTILEKSLDDDAQPEEINFGDAYTVSFLSYLKEVEKNRADKQKIDAPQPISKWEDQPELGTDLNPEQDTTAFVKSTPPKYDTLKYKKD